MNSSPSPRIVVREVEPEEYEAAGELVVQSYISAGILSDDRGYDRILRDVSGRVNSASVLVAVDGVDVVGTGTVALAGSEHAEIAHGSEAEFRYFGVRPDMWGHGIGHQLVEEAENIAGRLGATDIVMSVIAHNSPALAMYEQHGFRRIPERDWYPAPDIALLVLHKQL